MIILWVACSGTEGEGAQPLVCKKYLILRCWTAYFRIKIALPVLSDCLAEDFMCASFVFMHIPYHLPKMQECSNVELNLQSEFMESEFEF